MRGSVSTVVRPSISGGAEGPAPARPHGDSEWESEDAAGISALCESMSPEELVEHPDLIARWARAKRDDGDLGGALAASRIASSLAFGDELSPFRHAEIIFQADTMVEAGSASAARELIESSIAVADKNDGALYDLHVKAAQLDLAAGDHPGAARNIDLAGRYAKTPRQLVSLVSFSVSARPAPADSGIRGGNLSGDLVTTAARSPLYVVKLFGGLEVSVSGRTVDLERWRKNKARSLFLSVVLEQGRDVSRDTILDRLWPQLDATSATNNYYVTWNGVKRVLATAETSDGRGALPMPIVNSGQRCALRREICRTDLDDFDEALAECRDARANGDGRRVISALARLVGIYRGDLLPGDTSCEWVAPYREYYRSQFIDAMGVAGRTAIDIGAPNEAVAFVMRGLSIDRYAEALYELLMEASIAAGRRDEGIRAFLRCRALFGEEYGLDPSRRLTSLYAQLLEMDASH